MQPTKQKKRVIHSFIIFICMQTDTFSAFFLQNKNKCNKENDRLAKRKERNGENAVVFYPLLCSFAWMFNLSWCGGGVVE